MHPTGSRQQPAYQTQSPYVRAQAPGPEPVRLSGVWGTLPLLLLLPPSAAPPFPAQAAPRAVASEPMAQGARAVGRAVQGAQDVRSELRSACLDPTPGKAPVGLPTIPVRPLGACAPTPFLPAGASNKLASSTRAPTHCRTPTEISEPHRDMDAPAAPPPRCPAAAVWGCGRRCVLGTHLTVEFRAGGARLPGPRLPPAWAFCCRLCPSRPSPPPHPPPPLLLARQGARRRRGGPAVCAGRRSWRRRSGRRVLMARGCAARRRRGGASPGLQVLPPRGDAAVELGGEADASSSPGWRGGRQARVPRPARNPPVAGRTGMFLLCRIRSP